MQHFTGRTTWQSDQTNTFTFTEWSHHQLSPNQITADLDINNMHGALITCCLVGEIGIFPTFVNIKTFYDEFSYWDDHEVPGAMHRVRGGSLNAKCYENT